MKNGHKVWSKREIMQLIDRYRQTDVLWNSKIPQYKNRALKQEALKELALLFDTPISEIQRKLHNLRCQLNSEVKKLRRRSDRSGVPLRSSWEYFHHLGFLLSAEPNEDYVEGIDVSEHLETMIEAESSSYFSQDTYEEYQMSSDSTNNNTMIEIKKEPNLNEDIVQDNDRNESLAGSNQSKVSFGTLTREKRGLTNDKTEEITINNGNSVKKKKVDETLDDTKDDSQIFGDFVAAELRNIKNEMNRKKLKRIILRGIIEASESED